MSLLGLADTAFDSAPRRPPARPTQSSNLNLRTTMEVILLERVAKVGQMGEVVRVKDGFARNYLLPRAKALAAATEIQQVQVRRHEGRPAGQELETKGEADKIGSSSTARASR